MQNNLDIDLVRMRTKSYYSMFTSIPKIRCISANVLSIS